MGCSFWLFVHTLEAVFTSFYKSGYNQVTTTIILELSFLLQASSVHGSSHYILAHAGSHLIPGLDGTDSRSSFLLSSCQISILRPSELTPIPRLIRKTSQSQLVKFPSHTEETSRRRGPSRPHQRGAACLGHHTQAVLDHPTPYSTKIAAAPCLILVLTFSAGWTDTCSWRIIAILLDLIRLLTTIDNRLQRQYHPYPSSLSSPLSCPSPDRTQSGPTYVSRESC
ncbi:hypothetical protein F5880DRAFT_1575992 [Lentinula raphanica]|nr:hypothetical protein F5880DRAFT_1575992 [Lentinula raphanica]